MRKLLTAWAMAGILVLAYLAGHRFVIPTLIALGVSSLLLGVLEQIAKHRTLKRLGWSLEKRDLLSSFLHVIPEDLEYVLPKDEYIFLPDYRSEWKEIDNLRKCIEISKSHKKYAKSIEPILAIIEARKNRDLTKPVENDAEFDGVNGDGHK